MILSVLSSCKVYKQDILFRLDEHFTEADLALPMESAIGNYRIHANDYLKVDVFTNKGERIVDPNNELMQGSQNQQMNRQQFQYLVEEDGLVKLPIIGKIKLNELTVSEAESVLEQAYNDSYRDCFVKITVNNRRVIVLGANGGQVVPLTNDRVTIAEVMALYGGLSLGAKAGNIRLIRGDLNSPLVYNMDLTTIEGMRKSAIEVMPGDVIYVEPWRRPWQQALRDVSPILSITSSVIAFVLVIQNLTQ